MTTDYLSLAEQALNEGEASRWKACEYCSKGVGLYQKNFTKDLAQRTGYEVSRISDFAQAGRAWEVLKTHMVEAERDRLKIDVFTYCDTLITSKGHSPEEVAHALQEVLEEAQKPTTSIVKDFLGGRFGIPQREPDPMKHVQALETWGETRMKSPVDHAAWFATTRTQRDLVKKVKGSENSPDIPPN